MKFLSLFLILPTILASCGHKRSYFQNDVIIYQSPRSFPSPIKTPLPEEQKKEKVIVLDPGHGGKDTGALSKKNSYEEKKLTLMTVKVIKSYLENLGYNVTLTRGEDTFVSLDKRAEMANDLNANLFVSLHYNYSENAKAEGVEIFYYQDEKNPFSERVLSSKKLGDKILRRIAKHTGAIARGVKKGNFAVVRETKMPAILIEAGFLSHPIEREKIKDEPYLSYLGWAIAKGIDEYVDSLECPRRESNARPAA